jgi:hypothetical protein
LESSDSLQALDEAPISVIPKVERELREKKQNCAKKTKLHHNTLIHPGRTLCQMLWRMLQESLNLNLNFAIFATCKIYYERRKIIKFFRRNH